MKKVISLAIILATVLTLMIPVAASAGQGIQELWVNCENGKTLNLREVPNTNSRILAHLECGTKVQVLENPGNGWLMVVPSNGGFAGYVMAKFLVSAKPGKYEITERDDNFVQVTPYIASAKALSSGSAKSVGLRVKPNKTARAIRRLNANDQLEVIARGKVWSRVIDLQTGKTGYVANDYLQAIL